MWVFLSRLKDGTGILTNAVMFLINEGKRTPSSTIMKRDKLKVGLSKKNYGMVFASLSTLGFLTRSRVLATHHKCREFGTTSVISA